MLRSNQPGPARPGNRNPCRLGARLRSARWKVNIAKSSYARGPMPLKSYTTVREAVPGGVRVSLGGERVDGIRIKATYTAKFDGTAAAVGSGTPYDSISIKQVERVYVHLRNQAQQ